MPSPTTSPVLGNASLSGIRAQQQRSASNALSVTSPQPDTDHPHFQSNTIQWRMTRAPTVQAFVQTDAHELDSLEDSIESMEGPMEVEPSEPRSGPTALSAGQQTRRSLISAMQSAAPEAGRRRSHRPTANHTQPPQNDDLFTSFVMQLASHPNGASGFEAIANNINTSIPVHSRTGRAAGAGTGNSSALRNKTVYQLRCMFCAERVCVRAMKAILLADTKIELYSTDIPPSQLCLLEEDRMTQGCHCRIRDTACRSCGNVLGYHVSQPCDRCLDAKNNGHFWMFYSETIRAAERVDLRTGKPVHWGALTPMRELDETIWMNAAQQYETFCR